MDYVIAVLIGLFVFRFLRNSISSLASIPPELDTDDVVEISQSFSCNKCGTQLTINRQSVVANEPPKHCKEEMQPLDWWIFLENYISIVLKKTQYELLVIVSCH